MLPCSAESAESHSDTHSGDGLQYGCQMVRHGSADAKPSCVQSDTWVIVWVRKDMCCLCLNFLQTTKKKNLIPCANNSVSTPIYIWAENKWLFLRHFLLLSVQPTVNMFVLWNSWKHFNTRWSQCSWCWPLIIPPIEILCDTVTFITAPSALRSLQDYMTKLGAALDARRQIRTEFCRSLSECQHNLPSRCCSPPLLLSTHISDFLINRK